MIPIKRISLYVRPNQFWIGIYYNVSFRLLYIQPLPMIGVRVAFKMVYE